MSTKKVRRRRYISPIGNSLCIPNRSFVLSPSRRGERSCCCSRGKDATLTLNHFSIRVRVVAQQSIDAARTRRVVPSASSNNTNNTNSRENSKTTSARRVRSVKNDFQEQEKEYSSYREKHGYNWTHGSADEEDGEYGTSSSSPVSEADAREMARNWLCTVGRQGQSSPIDFQKTQYDASRGKNTSMGFRGTLLDDPFTNNPKVYEFMRTRRGPMVGKLGKALRYVHGDEAYESYLGKHVDRHIRLARVLKLWRINFHIRYGREPGYDDMPSNLKSLELQYINIGFKLRELDG